MLNHKFPAYARTWILATLTMAACGRAAGISTPIESQPLGVSGASAAQFPASANSVAMLVTAPGPSFMAEPGDFIHFDSAGEAAEAQKIRQLIAEGLYDRALQAAIELEQRQPGSSAVLGLKGAVYAAMGNYSAARKSYEQALAVNPSSMAVIMNLAELDLREKNPDAARRRFEAILAKDQSNAEAMLGLAGIAAATGQDADYVSWLEKSIKAAPTLSRPRVLLAEYYLQKNDAKRALTVARDAQSVIPENPGVLQVLGTAQLANGDAGGAVITYAKYARLNSNDPVAQYRLATAQVAARDMSSARASLDKALTLKPDYQTAEILLATIELDGGRYAEALKVARRIERKYPDSAVGLVLEGDIRTAQKQYASALKAYEDAFKLNKTGALVAKMHQALTVGGKAKEADARILQWLNDNPNDEVARAYLAASYVKRKSNKQAIEQYQRLVATNPKNARALNDLAWLYQQENDSRARTVAEQADQTAPGNPEIMDTLGWILVEQGDLARGVDLLRSAAEKAPMSISIQFHFASALAKSGDKAKARKILQPLAASNKESTQRQQSRALLKQIGN